MVCVCEQFECVLRVFKHSEPSSKKGKKLQLSMRVRAHEHTHKHTNTAICSNGATRHNQAPHCAVNWLEGADIEGSQSKPDIKSPISNSRGRIHKKRLQKHTHTHTLLQQHFQCWLNLAFEVPQLCSSNLKGILPIRIAE